jgi:hypothetical protein
VFFPPATDLPPGSEGSIQIPGRDWHDGDIVELECRAGQTLIDQFHFRIGKREISFPAPAGPAPKVTEDNQSLTVQGGDFRIVFSKATGLISEGTYRGHSIIEGGPFLNLGGTGLSPWWLISMHHSSTEAEAVINLVGAHVARHGSGPGMSTEFEIRVDGQGLITTTYTLHEPVKAATQVGLSYVLSSSVDRLSWERKALWSAYPADHLGRPQGTAHRHSSHAAPAYRHPPVGPWSEDTKDFFLFGPDDPGDRGTNDFRSLKENIWWAACGLAGTSLGVKAEADGSASARAEAWPDGKVQVNINHLWAYSDLGYGVSMPKIALEAGYKNTVRLRLAEVA